MKTLGFTIERSFLTQVLLSILLGGLIGIGIEYIRGNKLAPFLCAAAYGIAAIARLRRQKKKI